MDLKRMGCVPFVGFWGAQLAYSLHYVITKSLFGFFVVCGRFFVLFCFTSFIFWLLPVSFIYYLGKLWVQRWGLQGAKSTLTTDLSTKASNIHLAVVWNKD